MKRNGIGARVLSGILAGAMALTMAPQTALTSFAQELSNEVVFEETVEDSAIFDVAEPTEENSDSETEETDVFETAYTVGVTFGFETNVGTSHAFVYDAAAPAATSGLAADTADYEKDYTFTLVPATGYQLEQNVAKLVEIGYQNNYDASPSNYTYVKADPSKGDYYAGDVKSDGSRDITLTKDFMNTAKATMTALDSALGHDGIVVVTVLDDAGIPKECEAVLNGDAVTTNNKVTVKKGTGKGSYKIEVSVTASGTADYASKTLVRTFTIRIV